MARARVVVTSAGYRAGDGSTMYAQRGELVELTDAELDRLVELGAVVPDRADDRADDAAGHKTRQNRRR